MDKSNKFSPEVRERAVRMVQEHRGEYPSLWLAVESIAPKIGCVPQTLLTWVKHQEIDAGVREGVTTTEAQRVKELEREVKELRRANEILKVASAFSPKRSSTADSSPEGAHRRAPRYVRGRADLQGCADLPVRISAVCGASVQSGTPLRESPARRRSGAADRTRLAGQHAGLRSRQGLASSLWA
jgi:transposase